MPLLVVSLAVLGLAIGSFLNVVAYRVPIGESVVSPPSHCPKCDEPIRALDNVPVLSWLWLRGKCRSCRARISVRYPVVEAFTAAAFAVTGWHVGLSWVLPAYLWFVAVTIVLTLTDLDHKRIPNAILYPSTIVGALLVAGGALIEGNAGSLLRAGAGAAGYFGFFFLLALVARGGFGFGDVKLAFFLGLFLAYQSWKSLSAAVFLGFVFGGVIALGLLLARRKGRKDALPFGPSMVAGAYAGLLWGEQLVNWYLP